MDRLVVTTGTRSRAALVTAVAEVMRPTEIMAPPQHWIVGARRVTTEEILSVDGGWLQLGPTEDRRLEVAVVPTDPG